MLLALAYETQSLQRAAGKSPMLNNSEGEENAVAFKLPSLGKIWKRFLLENRQHDVRNSDC